MPRKLAFIALFTLTVPTFALAQRPAETTTNPMASTSVNPMASAHATALAGQAKAARIEACVQASNAFLDGLIKADYKAATSNFNAQLRAAFGADKLAAAWRMANAQFGKLESRGRPQNVMYQGYVVVTTPLHFQRGNLNARLTCDASGKFAGFHMLPTRTAPVASSQ